MDNPIKKRMQKYVADAIGKATGEVVAKEAGKAVAKAAEKKSEQKTSTPAAAPKEPKIVKITRNLEGERKEYEPMEKKPMEKKLMQKTPMEDPAVLLSNLNKAMQKDFQETERVKQARAAMREEKKITQPMIIERFEKLKK
jgi:hypothetical protein